MNTVATRPITLGSILPNAKPQAMPAPISAMEAENVALRARIVALEAAQSAKARGNPMRLKVTEKGGLSVYGLGRFPVTLYKGQWQRLLEFAPEITAALPSLRDKGDDE